MVRVVLFPVDHASALTANQHTGSLKSTPFIYCSCFYFAVLVCFIAYLFLVQIYFFPINLLGFPSDATDVGVPSGIKTVRHQDMSAHVEIDSSAPRKFGIKTNRYQDKSAPHFLSNKRD